MKHMYLRDVGEPLSSALFLGLLSGGGIDDLDSVFQVEEDPR